MDTENKYNSFYPIAAPLASTFAAEGLGKYLLTGMNAVPKNKTDRDLTDQILSNAGKRGVGSVRENISGVGPAYHPAENKIYAGLGAKPAVAAHEAGHASGTFGKKFLQNVPLRAAAMGLGSLSVFGSMGAGVSAAKGIRHAKSQEEIDKALKPAKYLAVGGGALFSPIVAEELRANMRVPKILREAGASRLGTLKHSLKLLPALSTYLMVGAAPTLPYLITKRYAKRRAEELGLAKTSAFFDKPGDVDFHYPEGFNAENTKGKIIIRNDTAKDRNRRTLKQFAKNTAVVATATGLGTATGFAIKSALEKYIAKNPHNWGRALPFIIPAAGILGTIGGFYTTKSQEEKDALLSDATKTPAHLVTIKEAGYAPPSQQRVDPLLGPTIVGALGAGAAGAGAGGLANIFRGTKPRKVLAMTAGSAALGGLVMRHRAKKALTGE